MDESKKSKGSKSSALPVLDPVSEPVSPCVTPTEQMNTDIEHRLICLPAQADRFVAAGLLTEDEIIRIQLLPTSRRRQ